MRNLPTFNVKTSFLDWIEKNMHVLNYLIIYYFIFLFMSSTWCLIISIKFYQHEQLVNDLNAGVSDQFRLRLLYLPFIGGGGGGGGIKPSPEVILLPFNSMLKMFTFLDRFASVFKFHFLEGSYGTQYQCSEHSIRPQL